MGQRGTTAQGGMPSYLNPDYTVNPANIPSLNFRSPMTNIGNRIMNAPFINPDVRTAIGTPPFQNPAYQQGTGNWLNPQILQAIQGMSLANPSFQGQTPYNALLAMFNRSPLPTQPNTQGMPTLPTQANVPSANLGMNRLTNSVPYGSPTYRNPLTTPYGTPTYRNPLTTPYMPQPMPTKQLSMNNTDLSRNPFAVLR